jgi:hypothetical protein
MEKLIIHASKWYDKNLFLLNAGKTDVMTISNVKNPVLPKLNLKGQTFVQTENIEYLEVLLQNELV